MLGALEVVRTLNDRGIETERPFEVAIWTNEEGTRFTPVMMGSGVFAGVFGLDQALARTDLDGRPADLLEGKGWGDETGGADGLLDGHGRSW